ncbi:hypothetical protein [Virgibacillus chiguensis]|uniref:Uncharacterized protein n=1 Tax=Virgibacillus chiguensis TaxID=411959 RepID=A0A1M5MDI1_9BACI|nr:hypothetical protein [Virgibacillus chiguensis]SHG75325.1 hypothetical protein SAMN05421807_101463 [Virgibacillus chiguensis]
MIFFYRFFAVLALLVFNVLYIGLIVRVIIGISGSVLRTIGLTQIEIIFPPDISLPAYPKYTDYVHVCNHLANYFQICKTNNSFFVPSFSIV